MSNRLKVRKSWIEKLHESKDLPKIIKITPKMAGKWGAVLGETVVIPAPIDVDEVMKKVPKGKLITINEIRQALAKKYKANMGCPITCGIFAWIAAHAAEEERKLGKKKITPWWRTLKSDSSLNEKYPGQGSMQKALLEAEGHKIIQKGKKYLVADFKKYLVKV